jgi:hypothetical protein
MQQVLEEQEARQQFDASFLIGASSIITHANDNSY